MAPERATLLALAEATAAYRAAAQRQLQIIVCIEFGSDIGALFEDQLLRNEHVLQTVELVAHVSFDTYRVVERRLPRRIEKRNRP